MRFAIAVLLPMLALAQAPDAAEILRRSQAAGDKNSPLAELYTYREYVVNQDSGKRKTETWDVIGLEGSTYSKLIQRNDQPLSAKEQKSEDKRLAEETQKRRKENANPKRKNPLSQSYSVGYNRESAHMFSGSYKGEEPINGRPAYLIELLPKESESPANDNEKELRYYRIRQWIDEETYNVARFEMEVVKPGSRMHPGTILTFMSRPLEDGVWVMVELCFDFDLKVFKVVSTSGTFVRTRSDFHKFEVSSSIVQ